MSPVPAPEPSAGEGGSSAATLSRFSSATSNSGNASGVTVHVPFVATHSVGSDIAIDGGDSTFLNILVDGVYAISLFGSLGGALSAAEVVLNIGGSDVETRDDSIDTPCTDRDATISVTVFLPAGATIEQWAFASTSAGTWDVETMQMTVQRVA